MTVPNGHLSPFLRGMSSQGPGIVAAGTPPNSLLLSMVSLNPEF